MDAVEICNAALDMLGADRINALEDENSRAELCAARFPACRDAVIGERPWRWATQRHELAADPDAPAYGFAYRYPLPAEVSQVLEASDGDQPVDVWRREGPFILSDTASPIFIRSVDIIDDVALWPAGFCRAVETRLAADLCAPLSEGQSHGAELWKLYGVRLAEASLADAKQGRGERVFQGNLAARR